MDFDLDGEQEELVSAVGTLLERHAGAERARHVMGYGGYDRELMDTLVAAGFADTAAVGAGPLEAVLVTELVAQWAGCAPFGARALVGPAILGDSPAVIVPCDVSLPGPLRFAAQADVFLAARGDAVYRIDPGEVSIVPVESPFGYPLGSVEGIGDAGLEIPAMRADHLRRWWRVALAAEMVGLMEGALGRTLAYVTERHQFGRPLGSFQAIQHRLAELYVRVEGARWLTRYAAWNGAPPAAAAAAAAAAADVAETLVLETHQLTGAMGLTKEYDLYLWTMRLTALRLECGGARSHARALAAACWLESPEETDRQRATSPLESAAATGASRER